MKAFLKEYLDIIIYTICGILIIFSSYNIIINIKHANYINNKVTVSDIDNNFKKFKDNVIKIENFAQDDKSLDIVLRLLKNDGIYKLLPGDKLGYTDLYHLNNYFIDSLINNGYISNLKINEKINNTIYEKYMNNLIYDANYITRELENNSNYQYDVFNNKIRDTIVEEYQMILKNYLDFSYIILEMCGNL